MGRTNRHGGRVVEPDAKADRLPGAIRGVLALEHGLDDAPVRPGPLGRCWAFAEHMASGRRSKARAGRHRAAPRHLSERVRDRFMAGDSG